MMKTNIEIPDNIPMLKKKLLIIKRYEAELNEALSYVTPAQAIEMFSRLDLPVYRIESYAAQHLLGTMIKLHDPKKFQKQFLEWTLNNGTHES